MTTVWKPVERVKSAACPEPQVVALSVCICRTHCMVTGSGSRGSSTLGGPTDGELDDRHFCVRNLIRALARRA